MGKRIQEKEVLKEVVFFLSKFNILLIPFYVIIYFDISFYPLQVAFANFIAGILRFLKCKVLTSGFFLYLGEEAYPIDISRDCIGWKSSYSLFALVFATRGRIRDKLRFLAVWIPFLLFFNVLRVLAVILSGFAFGFEYLELIHAILWQGITIIVLLAVWYLWLKKRKLNRGKEKLII